MSDYTLSSEFAGVRVGAQQSIWRLDLILAAIAVFLSPINYLRAGFAYITLSDVFVLLTLAVMYAQGRVPLLPFGRASAAWYGSVFLLVLGLMLASVVNGDLVAGITISAQYCFSLLIIPMLLLQRSRAEVLFLIMVFIAAMVFVMLHGAWYMEFAPDDRRFIKANGRLDSLMERENAAAALAATAITFSMWLYFIRKIRLYMLVLVVIPLVYGLLLTGSNTGFFLTMIGAVCLVVLGGAMRILVGMVLVGGGLAFIILNWGELFLPEIFVERVLGALETGDMDKAGTFSDRMYLIHEAFGVTRHTIFMGIGADQYRQISAHGTPVHNTYMLVLAEGGMISLLGVFGLLGTGIMIGLPALLTRRLHWYGVLTVTSVIMLMLMMNGVAHFYARFWVVPWILALGMSLAPAEDGDDEEDWDHAYP